MCEFEVKITPWLLGDLPEAEAAEIERHVRDCPACTAVKAELELFIPELQNALDQDDIPLPTKINLTPQTPQHHPLSRLGIWTMRHAALFVAALTTIVITLMLALVRNNSTHRRHNNTTHTTIEFHKYTADTPPALKSVDLPESTTLYEDSDLLADQPSMPHPAAIPAAPPVMREPRFPDLPRLVPTEELAVLQGQPTQPQPLPPAAPASKMAKQRRTSESHTPMPLARTPIAVGGSQKLGVTNNISTNNLATNLNSAATNTLPKQIDSK